MALRMFTDETGWESSRKDVRFTNTGVRLVLAHAALVKPLAMLLADWLVIDQARREADDALVDCHAGVATWNVCLDSWVGKLSSRLLYECGDKPTSTTFQRYFPEVPSEVIRMGLETEIERANNFHDVAKELGASKEVTSILTEIATAQASGKTVIETRKEAAAAVGRVSLRMHIWKENANQARRGIEAALETYGVANGLERGYADNFFPAPKKAKKSSKKTAPTP